MINDLTLKEAEELFSLNKEEGILYWKERDLSMFTSERSWKWWNNLYAGKKAGCYKHNNGYVVIRIGSKRYRAHRIIWLMCTGKNPVDQIDHINHQKQDNRIENLRDISQHKNTKNRALHTSNKSGFNGVRKIKVKKPTSKSWKADIGVNNKRINLGLFYNKDDAIAARKAANIKYGFHENHGKK